MTDLRLVLLLIAFFALTAALIRLCEKLRSTEVSR